MRIPSRLLLLTALTVAVGFLGWRLVRPMNIFLVSEAFERPVDTQRVPEPLRSRPAAVEASMRYHLLTERRRDRIGYDNAEPIDYLVFKQRIALTERPPDK